MSELTDSLRTHGLQHKGTHLGGLLQWAALHIESQDQALADLREEHAREETGRMQMEGALGAAKEAIEAALAAVNSPLRRPIELGRDMCGHINLMAAHGDPDYLLKNGKSVRHIDLRSDKPRKKKGIHAMSRRARARRDKRAPIPDFDDPQPRH